MVRYGLLLDSTGALEAPLFGDYPIYISSRTISSKTCKPITKSIFLSSLLAMLSRRELKDGFSIGDGGAGEG